MLGVFQGTDKIKRLGSVRSARHYFVSFASEWNAIFCHFGQTSYAISKIEELGVDNLSGLSAIGGVVYKRDTQHVDLRCPFLALVSIFDVIDDNGKWSLFCLFIY